MTVSHFARASALALMGLACAASCAVAASAPHTLDIADKVGAFESFYKDAAAMPRDADARWALWKKEYGIAAVPPGPEGDKMARQLLDAAWDKYPALLPKLDALDKRARENAHADFAKINDLLKTEDTPIHARLVLYVGQFDDNAYTVPPMDGRPATVMMPVENTILRVALAHELTHAVHTQLADVKNSFGAPVGETMFLEGLAMRTSQQVVPGLPETAYTQLSTDADWLARCYANKVKILTAIRPDLDKAGRQIALKYTFGNGNTGMHREAYCAAWIVMGSLLKTHTLAELARIPEAKMVDTVRSALNAENGI